MRKILPSITSIGRCSSHWRDKIAELKVLEIRECALFVTGLSIEERTLCFSLLEETRKEHEFTIPFCHAVSTMHEDEFKFLKNTFGTQRFNLHPLSEFPLKHVLSETIREDIFIENNCSNVSLTAEDVAGFAGVCLDVSHLFDLKTLYPENLPVMYSFLYENNIGANHISGALLTPHINRQGNRQCSLHLATGAHEFRYVEHFPIEFFSEFCAIEVENPLREQLEFAEQIKASLHHISCDIKKAA